ncbi:hypothetical protein SLEP1_g56182 [Rubroshorea leprosula]|uniref:RNA-directed DNA polymerase n=1 Tax=Rubroshorea leprosula TaxID=152421 RepID=A0AAV5MLI3_9ROSI|nr:hypothetical protein SLEP1_g56182 [Rubroshorea leprosula]
MDEQEDTQLSDVGLNDFRPMPRNLFVGGAEQDQLSGTDDDERTPTGYATQPEQFQIPTGTRHKHPKQGNSQHERPERSMEPARTVELEERTRILEMVMGKILARLIPDYPLIPLLNRDAQPATIASRNSPALSNILMPTKPIGSGRLNNEPSSSKHSEELMRKNADLERQLRDVHQKEGESLRDYMQQFNKATLDIDNVPDTICLSALLHGLKPGRFLDNLLENPPKMWNEVNERFQILAQIQHWVRRPPPPLHDSSRVDKSKHCDYHRAYGHNTEDCQHIKDELEFLARNGKLEGYVQKPYAQQPTQTHFVLGYDRPQGQRYQLDSTQDVYQDNQHPYEQGYAGIPPPSNTINMISGGMHSRGLSARGHKAYARQVMNVNKNRPLKWPFKEVEWENAPITFNPTDYKQAEGEPDVMMPHANPFVATVHIGNHNVNKVFIDTSSSPNILYWSCFQKMQLNPSSLQKYEGPIYGFDNQPVPVEGVITLPIYVSLEPRFRMASVSFLVVKMESAFNAILGRATLCELKAVISQPHLYMNLGYHQVQLLLDDQEKTAFYADNAIYCYVMMPFGLRNAGATYQKLMQVVFNLKIGRNIEVYVDDMILTKSGKFLGYVASKKGIEVNPEKVQAIQQMEPPKTGESLYLYLGVSKEAVSSVLLREENKQQKPICYVSKVLQGAEQNYPVVEKATFALVYTAHKLRAYFQSHQIIVYIDLLLRKILQKPKLSDRLIGWSIELSEYDLKFQPRITVKGPAVADFLVECLSVTVEEKAPKYLVWVLYVDGTANIEGSGAEAVLKSGFTSFQINKIPKADNQRADDLSKLASSQDIHPQRSIVVEVLNAPSYTDFTIECQLLSTDPSSPSWTTPLIEYLRSGELPEDPSIAKLIKRRATHFTLLDNQIYKRAASMPLLRCLTPYEAEYAVREVHEGVCGTHIGGKTLARKLLRHGYYWPTMVEEAQSYVKKFGIPKQIIANNDPQFRAAALRSFCDDYGIELALTSVYAPQSNGQAESANKIVLRGLKTCVLAAHSNWVDELNKVLWSCRTTLSSTTGETPFSLAYGAEAVILVKVELPSDRVGQHDDPSNEQFLRENLDLVEEVREMSRIRNMAYQGRVAKLYNKRVQAHQFQVGDLVV